MKAPVATSRAESWGQAPRLSVLWPSDGVSIGASGVTRAVVGSHQALLAHGVRSQILAGLHASPQLFGVGHVVGVRVPPRVLNGRGRWVALPLNTRLVSAFRPRRAGRVLHYGYPSEHIRVSTPSVVTFHDLIPLRFPEFFPDVAGHRAVLRHCARTAAAIVASSQATANDIAEWFPEATDRLVMVPLGTPALPEPDSCAAFSARPFVLHVGRRDGYKNFPALVEAMSHPQLDEFALVCFGGGPFRTNEWAELNARGIAERAIQVSGDDRLLVRLYRQARCLVHPSLYEGFGLPLVEAMSQGCPIVSTGGGAASEIVGSAAVLADPGAEALADAMVALAGSDERRASHARAGRERARAFSWERTARGLIDVYEQVLAR